MKNINLGRGLKSKEGAGFTMTPKDLVKAWVEAFNRADVEALAGFYHDDAINHQVAESPVEGREAIRAMFEKEFAAARGEMGHSTFF